MNAIRHPGAATAGRPHPVDGGGAQTVFVDVTAAAVAELGLAPGRQVWLTAKATDLVANLVPVAG